MKSYLPIALSVASLISSSCSILKVEKTFHAQADDWMMYGGDIGRVNVSRADVQPPLSQLWEYDAGGGFSAYSAAVIDSILFVGTLKGEVHSVDITTGKGLGSHDFGSAVVGTPVLDDGTMYVSLAHHEESLIAYDVRDAKNNWLARLGDIESSPLLIGGKLFVTTVRGKLVCVNKNTGLILWTFEIPSTGHVAMIHSSPASDGKRVVFGSDNGSLYAVDINTGNLLWLAHTGGPITASPSVSAGNVYIGSLDHSLYAFDIETGKQVWRQDLGANIFSSQAVDDRHVFVGTSGRVLYCLNKDDGSIVWQYSANSVFSAAPLVVKDVLYAGCLDRTLYVFNAGTGAPLWQYKSKGRIKTMPIAWKEYLFVLAEDDAVIAFKSETER